MKEVSHFTLKDKLHFPTGHAGLAGFKDLDSWFIVTIDVRFLILIMALSPISTDLTILINMLYKC